MDGLAQKNCEACRVGASPVTAADMEEYMRELSDWKVVEAGGVKHLQRVFGFNNFRDALSFTNRVGEAAERESHHPAILTEWGKVTVDWWTHKIKGLHVNDFVMAAKTDALYSNAGNPATLQSAG